MNNEYEEIQDAIDEAEDDLEQGQDLADSQIDSYGTVPEIKSQQTMFQWFWKVVRLEEPFRAIKVGNLSNVEIGQSSVSVRDAMSLAHLGKLFHHETFSGYFNEVAKITSATSMAKAGWFMDLSISQRKIRERARKPLTGTPWKKNIFTRKTEEKE